MTGPLASPGLFTIPAGVNFAQTLAAGLVARLGPLAQDNLSLASTTIFLPTRRAARNFGDAFATALGGAALLPEFRALGEADEDEMLFDGLSLAPAISPIRRRLLLAMLISRWDSAFSFAQAASLADSLARLMDEAEIHAMDWTRLKELAAPSLAEHWQEVLRFLELVHKNWPPLLAAEGRADPAARRNQALALLCGKLKGDPRDGMVIAAGSTGSIPATAELLKTIAGLAQGAVVLPGLDRGLDEKSWRKLDDDPGHPQFGLKKLLDHIGADRSDVADWHDAPPASPREALLRETLRPAPTTDAWRALADSGGAAQMVRGLEGLSLAAAADPAEEALVIAMALRESLETENQSAALVTPDRSLARRVAGELSRWNIAIDDSAGRPLAHTSAGAFLCLLAEAAEASFAPVPLLALLKHPFATLGGDSAVFRGFARLLDRHALRGPRPDPGLEGVSRALARKMAAARNPPENPRALTEWWGSVAAILAPLEEAFAKPELPLDQLIAVHVAAAEKLACETPPDDCPLWRGPDGEAAAALIAEFQESAGGLPGLPPRFYPALLRELAMKIAVRPRFTRHRAIAILGPLEARLQHFDLVVLGGLNEGTWPAAPPADPWFSRPMRRTLGLEQPERGIGLAAHDFAMLVAGPRVLLTRARKAEGAPTIASRWLQRLEQLTGGLGLAVPQTDYTDWARRLRDARPAPPIARPVPNPPPAARPRGLSVTEIETWLRDPYAIYARHVLKLRPWEALDEEVGPLERGNALHKALELFVAKYPVTLPDDAVTELAALADEIFAEFAIPRAALAIWRPRFLGAARWFVNFERGRRLGDPRPWLEIAGKRIFKTAAGDFELRCRADRIDVLPSGAAAVFDYKTGRVPGLKQVARLLSPQLPLTAAILAAGGFAEIGPHVAEEMAYLGLSGGIKPGAARFIPNAVALTDKAVTALTGLIERFYQEETGYASRLIPYRTDLAGDYDHLARVREWSASGWSTEEDA